MKRWREGPGRGRGRAAAARRPSVVITTRLFSPEPAAASFRLAALATALHEDGFEVTVLTSTAPPNVAGSAPASIHARVPADVTVKRWPVLRDADGYVRGYLPYLSFDLPLALRLLRGPRPDVIITEPPPTTGLVVRLLSQIRRVPYVYYAADVWSQAVLEGGSPPVVASVLRRVESLAVRGAARVLTVNDGTAARLRGLGVAADRVTVVGNGTDTTVFTREGVVADHAEPYLVYAGTASEVHGATIFLDAMRRVLDVEPAARLVIIGQGTDRPAMEEQARELPEGAVSFFPRLDPTTTATWLRGARAALASVRPGPYGFAVATKLYAALACGTPVIQVGPGPAAEMVRENHLGTAVDYEVDAVAAAMLAALRAPLPRGERQRLADWAERNASLRVCAGRGAAAVSVAAGVASLRSTSPTGAPADEERA